MIIWWRARSMTRTKKISQNLMVLSIIYIAMFLISNVIASKQVAVGPWSLTAGVICFPISYVLSDVIAEIYGLDAAKKTILLAFGLNVLMVGIFMLTIIWPAPVWFENSEAFKIVLGNTPRLLGASLLAFLVGSMANAFVLTRMRGAQQGTRFGFRAIVSTLVGESLDSIIFIPLAFFGTMPIEQLMLMFVLQVAFKTSYEILILPVTYKVVKYLRRVENE